MKVGFIGAGNMGGALAEAVNKVSGATVVVSSYNMQKATALQNKTGCIVDSTSNLVKQAKFIFIGVKPNVITDLYAEISPFIAENKGAVIVSMLAGVTLQKLEGLFKDRAIIRIMPNTPVAVGKGVVLTAGNAFVSDEKLLEFKSVMAAAGDIEIIDEALIDAGTALSGCSPAFVYMFIDALACGANEAGLEKSEALKFAAKTLIGAATLLLESGKAPEELRDAVCSKGGSTIEGVKSLFANGFDETVKCAVLASYKRTLELGK